MLNAENADYYCFTGKQRLDKQMHSLEGLLRGIGMDGKVNDDEVKTLAAWLDDNREYARFHPFNEVFPVMRSALADGVIDDEEREDLLWLCRRLISDDRYFDAVTSDMQRLQGLIGGIAADGVITEEELRGLSDWMADHEHLRTLWPYDEIESLTADVLADGKITEREQEILVAFFNEFLSFKGGRAVNFPDEWKKMTRTGVCSVCQEMEFRDRSLCFTGKSQRASRRELEELISQLGGRFSRNLTKDVTYLIVGADGNDCWAYACYGRKVEQAVDLRRKGHPVLIVHEFDFWDCVDDAG